MKIGMTDHYYIKERIMKFLLAVNKQTSMYTLTGNNYVSKFLVHRKLNTRYRGINIYREFDTQNINAGKHTIFSCLEEALERKVIVSFPRVGGFSL